MSKNFGRRETESDQKKAEEGRIEMIWLLEHKAQRVNYWPKWAQREFPPSLWQDKDVTHKSFSAGIFSWAIITLLVGQFPFYAYLRWEIIGPSRV